MIVRSFTVSQNAIIAISLKMYMTPMQTLDWFDRLVEGLPEDLVDLTDFVVIPSFVSIADLHRRISQLPHGKRLALGAQNVFWEASGAFTGEISAPMLTELGCRYVEIGHAERRQIFGETDDIIAKKFAAATRAGLTPILCVGETSRGSPMEAVASCLTQIEASRALDDGQTPFIVAWEPVWAIGAERPASTDYIREVALALRQALYHIPGSRLIYGGSAGPGLLVDIGDVVDGLFLGRFAHKTENVQRILGELAQVKG